MRSSGTYRRPRTGFGTRTYTSADQVDPVALERWLAKSRAILWDYRNLVRRKGRLERLV